MRQTQNKTSHKDSYSFLSFHLKSSISKFKKQMSVANWPISWLKITFKTYPRFQKIYLDNKISISKENDLVKLLDKRRSWRKFKNYKIRLNEVNLLLQGAKINKIEGKDIHYNSFRPYPSAGARYPLELYLIVLNSRDLNKGIYHYNVKDHALEYMWKTNKEILKKTFGPSSFILKSGVILIITAVVKRALPKYGDRSYRFALIEAGHLAQNILLLASMINLKSVPIGGFIDKNVQRFLDLKNEELELPLYALAIGK